MTLKDDIIKLINVAYRQDEFVNDFTGAVATVMNTLIQYCQSIHDNIFFDTLDNEGVEWWEKSLAIVPASYQTIDDRRSKIQAKWMSKNHNDVVLLQRVCNAWKNGEIQVDFIGGKITLTFVSSYGIPSDLDGLKASIEEVKPAHIPLAYIIKYLLKNEIHHVLTKSEMQTYKKHQYCDVKIGV